MIHKYLVFCLLALIFWQPAYAANPDTIKASGQAYYLVFNLDTNGEPELVFQRQVIMSGLPVSDNPVQSVEQSKRGHVKTDFLTARIINKSGEQLFQKRINLNEDIRAEFAGDDGRTIERYEVKALEQVFVLRIPAFPSGTLKLENHSVTDFSIDNIATETARIQASTQAVNEAGQTIQAAEGSSTNRLDILVMGDGYMDSESDVFDNHVQNFKDSFFGISPYLEYRDFVKTTALFVASAQSGADHPPYDEACEWTDASCCADIAAQNDPLAGTFVDTPFDSTFCSANLHRLLTADTFKVYTAAADYPDWDKIILLVNDTDYGGSGGGISVASAHPLSSEVVMHEFGHSFTNLADEYDSAFPSYPDCSDLPEDVDLPACEANSTNVSNRQEIKWTSWINGNTPVPTPAASGYDGIGLFEGSRYLKNDMYRPKDICQMRYLGNEFCAVCKQEYVLQMFAGGWGVPDAGIELIEPGSALPLQNDLDISAPTRFTVDVLQPTTGVSIVWRVDGVIQNGETTSEFYFAPNSSAVYMLEVEVSDNTSIVSPEMKPQGALTSTRKWTVNATIDNQFLINAGLNDAWYYEVTNGQGFFITIFPELQYVSLSWFTYDTQRPDVGISANLGEPGHRWLLALGPYTGNKAVMDVSIASGGVFDSPVEVNEVLDGTIVLTFDDCENATVNYDIPSIDQQGSVPIKRVVGDNIAFCESLQPQAEAIQSKPMKAAKDKHVQRFDKPVTSAEPPPLVDMNVGLNDAWYYQETAGQGFFITVFPVIGYVNLSWFTYDTERPAPDVTANLGEPGHRWLLALGEIAGNQAVMDISIASGGIFDNPTEVTEIADGSITLTFSDCENGTVAYDIPSIQQKGVVPIQRVVNDNISLCESLLNP